MAEAPKVDAPKVDAEASPRANPTPRRRRRANGFIKYIVIGLIALVAIGFAGREVQLRMTHVYEYDARVVTDHVTIASQVDGNLSALSVEAGDMVEAGQLLAQVDDRVDRLELEALKAELSSLDGVRDELLARSAMVTKQTDSRYKTRLTSVRVQRARRSALSAELRLAQQELDRFQNLFERRVIARSRLDRAESEVARLGSELRRADAEIAASRGQAAEAEADKGELTVLDREMASLEFRRAELLARIAKQEALIAKRAIRAPKAGVVDRVFVEKGEFVGEGRRILMLHDPKDVWIEANVKETEVRRLKKGQWVNIDVDAYPDDAFGGRVARIGTAATSRFALLPTPNPSGNFTKVTQRIPVKITFVDPPRTLAPGMMVEIEIDTEGSL